MMKGTKVMRNRFFIGLGTALRISLVLWALIFVGVSYALDYTIVPVTEEVVESETIDPNIKKYDITRFKKIKDIKDVEFTVVDKVERLDLHQLNYDNAQEQKSIEQMTASIAELQDRIAKRNLLIADIKAIDPVVDKTIKPILK